MYLKTFCLILWRKIAKKNCFWDFLTFNTLDYSMVKGNQYKTEKKLTLMLLYHAVDSTATWSSLNGDVKTVSKNGYTFDIVIVVNSILTAKFEISGQFCFSRHPWGTWGCQNSGVICICKIFQLFFGWWRRLAEKKCFLEIKAWCHLYYFTCIKIGIITLHG